MATPGKSRRRKWEIDFTSNVHGNAGQVAQIEDLPAPVGFCTSLGQLTELNAVNEPDTDLVVKKSWEIALAPLKQIPMNMFIMFMAGSSISIFPIMMVGMMFMQPIRALLSIQATFQKIQGAQAILQRLVYFAGNCAALVLALYKCHSMGLLPNYASDWLAFQEPLRRIEFTGGGMALS